MSTSPGKHSLAHPHTKSPGSFAEPLRTGLFVWSGGDVGVLQPTPGWRRPGQRWAVRSRAGSDPQKSACSLCAPSGPAQTQAAASPLFCWMCRSFRPRPHKYPGALSLCLLLCLRNPRKRNMGKGCDQRRGSAVTNGNPVAGRLLPIQRDVGAKLLQPGDTQCVPARGRGRWQCWCCSPGNPTRLPCSLDQGWF